VNSELKVIDEELTSLLIDFQIYQMVFQRIRLKTKRWTKIYLFIMKDLLN